MERRADNKQRNMSKISNTALQVCFCKMASRKDTAYIIDSPFRKKPTVKINPIYKMVLYFVLKPKKRIPADKGTRVAFSIYFVFLAEQGGSRVCFRFFVIILRKWHGLIQKHFM